MTDIHHPPHGITIRLDANRPSVPELRYGESNVIDTNPPKQALPKPANDDSRDSYRSAWKKLQTWKRQIQRKEREAISWSQRLILKNCRERIRQLEQKLIRELNED